MSYVDERARTLRNLLDAPGVIELPGCYDALSAMILQHCGFPAVFLSGYGVAASLLGSPDTGLTTLVETALVAKNVARSIDVPLVVDADNGYGNEDNVVRTIQELETAGAAAIVLEDQVLPKRCGHSSGKEVVPLPVYMKSLEAALAARSSSICIVARTDSNSLDDAILRAQTFHRAGADVLLIDGLQSLDAVKRVADEVPGHKQINLIHGGLTPALPADQLHQLGFKIVQYSTPALYVAAASLFENLTRLRETHDLRTIADASIRFRDFQDFIERRHRERTRSSSRPPPRSEVSAPGATDELDPVLAREA